SGPNKLAGVSAGPETGASSGRAAAVYQGEGRSCLPLARQSLASLPIDQGEGRSCLPLARQSLASLPIDQGEGRSCLPLARQSLASLPIDQGEGLCGLPLGKRSSPSLPIDRQQPVDRWAGHLQAWSSCSRSFVSGRRRPGRRPRWHRPSSSSV